MRGRRRTLLRAPARGWRLALAPVRAPASALTVGLVTLGVGAVALLMFVSAHDALVMALLLVFAGGADRLLGVGAGRAA